MSKCAVRFAWADGEEYGFDLSPIGCLRDLDEKTNAGPEELLARLNGGLTEMRPRAGDLREIIRCGLIGGGTEPLRAAALVSRWVDARPRSESYLPARAILIALLLGIDEGQPKKKLDEPPTASGAAASPSPPTTKPEEPSASPPATSTG
ncbi:MAG TPA: gene transfer agent family protein [Rhizomicrobium sp.]|jgi:hypothetical protein|nr:gene transfer agent family protein [Rhizomicrobium sp.]